MGAGGIAASLAGDLGHGNNALYAVAARDAERSAASAREDLAAARDYLPIWAFATRPRRRE